MKRNLSLLFLCSIFPAYAESNSFSSQFLKLLVPSDSVGEKSPKKQSSSPSKSKPEKKEPEVKVEDKNLDRLLQLLVIERKSNQKKLYRDDLETFNFEYIDHLEFDQECAGFPKIDEKKLTKVEKELAKRYAKLIAQGHEAPWYLKCINEQVGHGIFADADIEEDQMIGEYTGIIIETSRAQELDMSYAWTILSPEHYRDRGQSFFVNAKKAGNFVRFINHSSYPNIKPLTVYSDGAWHMIYIAARPIKKDEQILVNYGPGYWISKSCKPVELSLGQ